VIIHVYTMVHNEEILMPYFLRHYKAFCQKITVFDNESSDRTAEIAKAAGADVIPIATGGKHDVEMLLMAMNEGYAASRGIADWVICAEGDEFFWHPKMPKLLEKYKRNGITLPQIIGFDMVSNSPPQGPGQIYDEIKRGFPNNQYSKRGVFQPVLDINFKAGGHGAIPTGPVKESAEAEILLLHYRYLGLDYFSRRYEQHRRRLSEESLLMGWGLECLKDHKVRYNADLDASAHLITTVLP
jgi:glycosyltransferase involved in cell wall biosynthesis